MIVRCVAIEYTDFPTVEWTLHFKNTGKADTPIIEAIKAVDTDFSGAAEGGCVLHHHTGDICTPDSYAPHAESISPGAEKTHRQHRRPAHAIRVSLLQPRLAGQRASIRRAELGRAVGHAVQRASTPRICVSAAARNSRTSSCTRARRSAARMVVVQFYNGDWLRGQNLWRQWMVAHNLPRPGGKLVQPMASLCTGNYYPGLMSNAAQELLFLRKHVEQGIRFDAWWQDAGWYPCDGVTWPKTGTWEVDRGRFPKGLREVSDYVHAQGAKSIVWFEPERVHAGTWLAEQASRVGPRRKATAACSSSAIPTAASG